MGLYPKMGILTINTHQTSPSGPLAQFIKEENFVSGVAPYNISLLDEGSFPPSTAAASTAKAVDENEAAAVFRVNEVNQMPTKSNVTGQIARGVVSVLSVLYQAGREIIEMVLQNILPFIAFVSALMGIVVYIGIGDFNEYIIAPVAGNLAGLLIISFIFAIPVLSPMLGPGAIVGQVFSMLIGMEIGRGKIPPHMALPALFAINPQVGADFAPVGLTLGEAKSESIKLGVPAMLFSRQITGPIAVLIAYVCSFGLYS
jgi:PTS system glucitol/sorbitol-specific IIB component